MKRALCGLAIAVLACSMMVYRATAQSSTRPPVTHAVIIQGWAGADYYTFMHTAYYVKWVLQNVFEVPRDNITYLVSGTIPGGPPAWMDYDGYATLANVREAVQWLGDVQGGHLFLYILSHGGGFNLTHLNGGRWDISGDEGNEHLVSGMWKGVDECIGLDTNDPYESYWDDDLAADIGDFRQNSYTMTTLIDACRNVNPNSTGNCFSGGFIDDLSGNYRTIVTSSNETGVSWYSGDEL